MSQAAGARVPDDARERGFGGLLHLPGPDSVLIVRAAGRDYGLPLAMVGEVVRVPPVTRVPHVPPAIRGVAAVRGEVVPVLDLGERLRGTRTDVETRDARLVTVYRSATGERVALLVEGVGGVMDAGSPEAAPPELAEALPSGTVLGVLVPTDPLEEAERAREEEAALDEFGGRLAAPAGRPEDARPPLSRGSFSPPPHGAAPVAVLDIGGVLELPGLRKKAT